MSIMNAFSAKMVERHFFFQESKEGIVLQYLIQNRYQTKVVLLLFKKKLNLLRIWLFRSRIFRHLIIIFYG